MTKEDRASVHGNETNLTALDVANLVAGRRVAWTLATMGGLLVALLVLFAGISEAAPSPVRLGTPAEVRDTIPTLMARWGTEAVDLDHDGNPEFLVIAGDGVMHKYAAHGRFVWGLDTQDVAKEAGLVSENAGHFIGDFQYILPQSAHAIAYTDLNNDGVDDILATMFLAVDAPQNNFQSALLRIDGASGQILDLRLTGGLVTHLILADFDLDGTDELFIFEEDGVRHLNQQGAFWIGTGNTTHAWVEEVDDGTVLWHRSSGLDWARATSVAIANLDGSGPDLVVALTGAFPKLMADLDQETTHFTQTLFAVDGATGAIRWTSPNLDYVRDIQVEDLDGDLIDDLLLRIQEPRSVIASRGFERGHLEVRSGLDASTVWTRIGMFGSEPRMFDMRIRGTGATATVAVAYTEQSGAPYAAEDIARLDLLDYENGDLLDHITLPGSGPQEIGLITSSLGLAPLETPTQLAAAPGIRGMRLAETDLDGDGGSDVVVGSDRGLAGVRIAAGVFENLWQNPVPADRHVLFTETEGATTLIWTQDIHMPRLMAYRAADGTHLRDIPLVGLALGVVRADVNGDDTLDRVIGGSAGALFAFDGGSESLLWTRDLGFHILDLAPADVDRDGTPDILVVGDRAAAAVDGSTGALLWGYSHLFAEDGGEFRAWQYGDLDSDGVKDIVIGYRSGENGGTGLTRLAQVIVLSGASGEELWVHTLPPPIWAVNGIALGDVDGDAVPDVAFSTQTAANAHYYGVGVLDGATGLPLWRVDTLIPGGRNTIDIHSVVMGDADGDGGLDVLVPTRGGATFPAALVAHDGLTGLEIYTHVMDSNTNLWNEGVFHGRFGVAGGSAIAVASRNLDAGGMRITVLTPQGGELYRVEYPGLGLLIDVVAGDVDGDGIDDLVLATPQGFAVIDSGPTLVGETTHIGHVTGWSTTKVVLVDTDGDGAKEIEFLTDPQNFPVFNGPFLINDLARGKAVGTADLGGIVLPPDDLPPVAMFVVDTNPVIQGAPAELRSTSFDPDSSLVRERWFLPGGAIRDGHNITFTFNGSGLQPVRLEVLDDQGLSASIVQNVLVRPLYGFTATPSLVGTFAAPGKSYHYSIRVENTGATSDTYTPKVLAVPHDWTATLVDAAPVTLGPGANHTYTVNVTIVSARPMGIVSIAVDPASALATTRVDHKFIVPLNLRTELLSGPGPYGPEDDIAGKVTLTWADGTPVANTWVRFTVNGGVGADFSVQTGADGQAVFLVQKDLVAVHSPGARTLIGEPVLAPYNVARVLHFTVQPVPTV